MRSSALVAPRSRAFGFDTSTGPIPSGSGGRDHAHAGQRWPVRQFEIGMPGEERRELRLDRLLDQPLRAAPQNFGQRIVNLIWLTERDNSILVHGVTLLREARVGVAPTPLRRSNHTVITHFPA